MNFPTSRPVGQFNDINGKPLEDGRVWFGQPNLDPIANPITVYWDAAGTQPVTQPVQTIGGYPVNGTTRANVFVNSDYSVLVRNRNGFDVFSAAVMPLDDSSANQYFLQAGAGAVVRTAQSKMRDVVSVKDFGAVGDWNGTTGTNDAAAIQNAVAAAAGKILLFETGKAYLVQDEVLLQPNTTIDLQGATVAFDVSGSKYNFKLDDDCVIRNGTVRHINTTNEPGVNGSFRCPITIGSFNAGIVSQGSNNCIIENMTLYSKRPNGQLISIYSDSFNVLIQNCRIYNDGGAKNGIAAHWSLDTGTPANGTQHPSTIKVLNCLFADLDVGIYLSSAYNVSIENCQFFDCGKGVEAYRGDYSNTYAPASVAPFVGKGIDLRSSIFRGCAIGVEIDGIEGLVAAQNIMSVDVSSCQFYGPAVGTSNDRGLYIRGTARASVRDSLIQEFDGYGIDFVGDTENVEIDSCVINGNELGAIWSRDTDNILGVKISNSRIYSNSASSAITFKPAVQISALCRHWSITNCEFGVISGETQGTSIAIHPSSKYTSVVNNHTYGVVNYCYRITGATSFTTTSEMYLDFYGNTAESGLVVFDGSPVATVVGEGTRQAWYSAVPTTGTWLRGDIVWNTAPASAGYIGWVCVTAGTPGTWQTFGLIS